MALTSWEYFEPYVDDFGGFTRLCSSGHVAHFRGLLTSPSFLVVAFWFVLVRCVWCTVVVFAAVSLACLLRVSFVVDLLFFFSYSAKDGGPSINLCLWNGACGPTLHAVRLWETVQTNWLLGHCPSEWCNVVFSDWLSLCCAFLFFFVELFTPTAEACRLRVFVQRI